MGFVLVIDFWPAKQEQLLGIPYGNRQLNLCCLSGQTEMLQFDQLRNLSLSSCDQYQFKAGPSKLIVDTSIFLDSISLCIWKYLSVQNSHESGSSPLNIGISTLNLFRSPAFSSLSAFFLFRTSPIFRSVSATLLDVASLSFPFTIAESCTADSDNRSLIIKRSFASDSIIIRSIYCCFSDSSPISSKFFAISLKLASITSILLNSFFSPDFLHRSELRIPQFTLQSPCSSLSQEVTSYKLSDPKLTPFPA
uniref:Uncharacterized protein n=1 Tax=Cucumis melo TaxID=3656 RepID=A0A9I9EKV8_CUCME